MLPPRAPPDLQLAIVVLEDEVNQPGGWAICEYQSGPGRIVKSSGPYSLN